ncbi:MAG: Glyoxalase/bleomycin resistance protein/dioxygenase [Desulfotomaculum sp. 46_296]|nr:MAG: Glyoxalase/bleomycin resistance protein/dioxygenase [Desulfotomaculum sp. 46_296]
MYIDILIFAGWMPPKDRNCLGHYEIALSFDNYEAVDLKFKEVVFKGAIPVLEPLPSRGGNA